jgi:hypothetical protein
VGFRKLELHGPRTTGETAIRGPAETEAFWAEPLRDLDGRDLQGVKLVVFGAQRGLRNRS